MTLSQAVIAFFRKRFDFSTRSRRSEYWWVTLAYVLATIVAMTIDTAVLGYPEDALLTPTLLALELALLVPLTAVTARRFHDVGMTGWAQLPSFFLWLEYFPQYEGFIFGGFDSGEPLRLIFSSVFLLYIGWVLFYMVKDSQPGINRYGPNPKDPNLSDVFD